MAPGQAPLKQSDLTRYAKAMRDAGYPEWRVEVRPDGTHVIIAGQPTPGDGRNPCDELLPK